MSDLVKVRYLGQEEVWTDYLYNSGATFTKGGVVAVDARAADQLLQHPEFEAAESARKYDVAEKPERKVEEDEPPLADLESMTKDQMLTYAQRNFGVVLKKTEAKDNIRNTIRSKMGSGVRTTTGVTEA